MRWLRPTRGMSRSGIAVSLALLPIPAMADGGGPVLIFAGPVVFLVAQVWIITAEAIVLHRLARAIPWPDVWADVASANLRSYLFVGILLPVAVSLTGLALGSGAGYLLAKAGFTDLARTVEGAVMGFSGMVYENPTVGRVLPYGLVTWFVVTFFLSVGVEGKVLRRRWAERDLGLPVSAQRASWIMNSVSYAGLTLGIGWIVLRMLAP